MDWFVPGVGEILGVTVLLDGNLGVFRVFGVMLGGVILGLDGVIELFLLMDIEFLELFWDCEG